MDIFIYKYINVMFTNNKLGGFNKRKKWGIRGEMRSENGFDSALNITFLMFPGHLKRQEFNFVDQIRSKKPYFPVENCFYLYIYGRGEAYNHEAVRMNKISKEGKLTCFHI